MPAARRQGQGCAVQLIDVGALGDEPANGRKISAPGRVG
jgi:hypothetical protein